MQNPAAQQVVQALQNANNVMVTVKNNPSVDELTAAVALTLILNHLNKHATTVFSGVVPSTIEFLQPEMAIETNTDSLRDFIIALDKSKADKLRYKVEDNVVRIFITPYRTSISEKDLEFSQGDFNVDVVVALGVVGKQDFDHVVTSHGRILHDATVIGVTKQDQISQIGGINWQERQASSISEMITSIADGLGPNVLDGQIATALMTGIVAETDRFKNDRTTPQVLSLSSKLMSAGANQKLIAEKLEEPITTGDLDSKAGKKIKNNEDGLLEIGHKDLEEVQKLEVDDNGNLGVFGNGEPPKVDENNYDYMPPINSDKFEIYDNLPTDVPESSSEISRDYISPLPPPPSPDNASVPDILNGGQSFQPPPQQNNTLRTSSEANSFISEHEQRVIEPLAPIEDTLQVPSPITSPRHKGMQYQDPSPVVNPTDKEDNTNQTENALLNPGNPSDEASPLVPLPPKPRLAVPPPPHETVPAVNTDPEPLLPPMPTPQPSTSSEPNSTESPHNKVSDDSTLLSLEKAVNSPHLRDNSETANIDDYIGSTRQPVQVSEPTPAVENKEEKPEIEPEKPLEPEKPPVDIPKPSSAPVVPPPLMPQAPMMPQFYEADGKKSNPFLNPDNK